MKIILLIPLKKNCIFSLFFCLNISSLYAFEISNYEKKIKTNYNLTSITEKISKDAIEKNLRDFVDASRPSRFIGSAGHKKALEYLEAKLKRFNSPGTTFEKMEFNPDIASVNEFQSFAINPQDKRRFDFLHSMKKVLESLKEQKGYNLIWEKKGNLSPQEVIIIGANYDTLLINPENLLVETQKAMPGADNNATGVAALLSMIEIFDKLDLPKTVRIVFFDFDQLGFLGSKDYAQKLNSKRQEKIIGYVNLLMLGNDSKRDDKEKKLNNMKVYLRSPGVKGNEDDLALATLLTSNGKRLYRGIEFTPEANGMNFSSHVNFWNAGFPAICFSQNWENDLNPRLNTPNDFVETLNMPTYVNAFRYITGALLAWNYDIVK